ncbi:MAG: AAA family ATPase [Eubacteriales bacterium]|nr:AAA family ATPase [Eubacteriales bacterium]
MQNIRKKKLPIGIENFEEIREEDFYYIDKTGLIKELLDNWGKVNLFTRPRRFGKSLNMSMLKCFFELNAKKALFDGLEISKERAYCKKYMGKFPVISVSLKGIQADTYEKARDMAIQIINEEARRQQALLTSDRLTKYDKEAFIGLLEKGMDEGTLCSSLKILSELLQKHYNQKVILLIDEYDVPLEKAFRQGYYEQMVILMRNLFEQVLKTNDSLQFAVLTGCMRISKESIFTGLNNLRVLSIADVPFDEYFGFTDGEIKALLEYYQLSDKYNMIKEWYDGYQFGNKKIYCPWDVMNYCDVLRVDPDAQPRNYWSNTSSNDVVRHFIREAGTGTTKRELEKLVAGEIITKELYQELTYKDMYRSIENLWSVLFTTGYLTQRGKAKGRSFQLAIPNLEVRDIFTSQIMEFFKENVKKDGEALNGFCEALKNGKAEEVEKRFGEYLRKTISIRDTFVRKHLKENFYHGILLGILGFKESWGVFSSRESGDGYSDILIEIEEEEMGIVIEMKYSEDGELEQDCQKALAQIEKMRYEETLREEGIDRILKYGIACEKKRCRVLLADSDG